MSKIEVKISHLVIQSAPFFSCSFTQSNALEFLTNYLVASTGNNSALDLVLTNAKYYRLVVEEAAQNATRNVASNSSALDGIMKIMTEKFNIITMVCKDLEA